MVVLEDLEEEVVTSRCAAASASSHLDCVSRCRMERTGVSDRKFAWFGSALRSVSKYAPKPKRLLCDWKGE